MRGSPHLSQSCSGNKRPSKPFPNLCANASQPFCSVITDNPARRRDSATRPRTPARRTMTTSRSNPYEYRRRLPHFQKTARPMFVTFRKLSRDPFPPAARTQVLEHCFYENTRTIHLHCAVVMPEHVHLLLTPLADSDNSPFPLFRILKRIKGSQHAASISFSAPRGRSGRTSRSITCFDPRKASARNSNTFARIP